MSATALLVWVAAPFWPLFIPAMALHGVTIVTLFAPMHECVHRTAFASRAVNVTVGWLAGIASFYNSTYYWHFHSWHHRYTQDPARDPELAFSKASNLLGYVREISGVMFWVRRAIDYPALAFRTEPSAVCSRQRTAPDRRLGVGSVADLPGRRDWNRVRVPSDTYFWFVPAILAQPFLRILLIAEHTGCSLDRNGLTNTRTTLTSFPIRLLMWNMPYHTIGYYWFTSWVPTLLLSQGINITKSLAYTFVIALASPGAALAATQFADRLERKWQLAGSALGIAVFGLCFSQQRSAAGIVVFGLLIAFSNTMLAYSLHTYQSELYPTRIRARAVGFTYSWSRFSTIFVGFFIAFFLRNYGTTDVFLFIATAMVSVFVVIASMGPRTTNLRLEAISR